MVFSFLICGYNHSRFGSLELEYSVPDMIELEFLPDSKKYGTKSKVGFILALFRIGDLFRIQDLEYSNDWILATLVELKVTTGRFNSNNELNLNETNL